MNDHHNVEVSPIELSDDELETVSGSEIDIATFFQVLSNTIRMISDVNKSMIANVR